MPATYTSRIPEISAAIPIRAGAAMRAATEAMAEEVKANAPDPPPVGQYLKESIEARSGEFSYGRQSQFSMSMASDFGFSTARGRQMVKTDSYGVWGSWYWHFVEYGTSRSAPEPFIVPAFENHKDKILGAVQAALPD